MPVEGQGGQFQLVFGPVLSGWTYTRVLHRPCRWELDAADGVHSSRCRHATHDHRPLRERRTPFLPCPDYPCAVTQPRRPFAMKTRDDFIPSGIISGRLSAIVRLVPAFVVLAALAHAAEPVGSGKAHSALGRAGVGGGVQRRWRAGSERVVVPARQPQQSAGAAVLHRPAGGRPCRGRRYSSSSCARTTPSRPAPPTGRAATRDTAGTRPVSSTAIRRRRTFSSVASSSAQSCRWIGLLAGAVDHRQSAVLAGVLGEIDVMEFWGSPGDQNLAMPFVIAGTSSNGTTSRVRGPIPGIGTSGR